MRIGRISKQKSVWIGLSLVLVLAAILAASLEWSRPDPWPPRLVIANPDGGRPQGFSADGRSFFTSSTAGVRSWDVESGQLRGQPTLPLIDRRTDSLDRTRFAGVVGSAVGPSELVWGDVASGVIQARFTIAKSPVGPITWENHDRSIRTLLETTSGHWETRTWEIASGAATIRPVDGPRNLGKGVAMGMWGCSPDGRSLAYLDRLSGSVQVWDADADRAIGPVLAAPNQLASRLSSVSFSPDGRTLFLGRDDGRIEVWDVATSRLVRTLAVNSRGNSIGSIRVAPDGRTLAANVVKLPGAQWYQALVNRLVSNQNPQMTFEVVLVDVASGQILAQSPGSVRPQFAPIGRTIITHEPDGTFAVRDVPQPPPPHQ